MWRRKWAVVLLAVLSALLLGLAALPGNVATAAQAVPPVRERVPEAARCRPAKILTGLRNEHQLEAFGLHRDIFGTGALTFNRERRVHYASLSVAPSENANPVAARITEVDTSLPPEQRIKCWQPTERFGIRVEFTIRYLQPFGPESLTENVFLWNSPFGETSQLPLTAVGVTRSPLVGGYVATVAQSVTFGPDDFIVPAPMPNWLDATQWHTVYVQLTQHEATISVAQGHRYETVLSTALPEPLEPLAFEASVDNEIFPGFHAPVTVPDTIDLAALAIRRHRLGRGGG